jgi:hypothetical protein
MTDEEELAADLDKILNGAMQEEHRRAIEETVPRIQDLIPGSLTFRQAEEALERAGLNIRMLAHAQGMTMDQFREIYPFDQHMALVGFHAGQVVARDSILGINPETGEPINTEGEIHGQAG